MKEETIDKITEKALSYLNSAEAFVGEQVPAYIEELVGFKIVEHLIIYFDDVIMLSILLTACIMLGKKAIKMVNRKDEDGCYYVNEKAEREITTAFSIIVPIMVGAFLLKSISSTKHLVEAYKAYKAPRVYLVEYFRK